MIKNSLHARKSFVRRASTMRYQERRKRSSKGKYLFYYLTYFTEKCVFFALWKNPYAVEEMHIY